MQDRALVAAIMTGDPDGLAEAYDRYAVPLYTYCRFMLPDPHPSEDAAGAVADTFLIAASRLSGLRDPDRLRSWLYAVARNECLRRLSPAELAGGTAARTGRQPPDEAMPEVTPPAGLREQILAAFADDTATGRAQRASVTHRAGPFDRKGFPKPVISARPRWWHEVQRHPRAATVLAAVAAAVVAAGITAALIGGTSDHRSRASTVAIGGGSFGASASAASSPPGARSSPSRKPRPVPGSSASSPDGPKASPDSSPDADKSSAPARPSPSRSPSTSPSPSPSQSPSPSPSSSPPPTPGTLLAEPTKLTLTATKGVAVSGTFLLTALGGPVDYSIHSANTKVTVLPAAGRLPSSGSFVSVTVTAKSLVSLDTRLTVDPGGLIITVVLTIKA
jgi:DNA-directed RNA polymerase specialized sigma24 family protein